MSEEELKIPPKFTFDEFYEMLKEYVNDPKAREYLATLDAEIIAGRGQHGTREFWSDVADEASGMFSVVGWSILAKHGWPSYYQIIDSTKDDHKLRSRFIGVGDNFHRTAKRLIRKVPNYPPWAQESFQDEDFDINDRASVLKLLKMRNDKYPGEQPYVLPGDK